MSARDVMFGRRGGGWLHSDHVVEGLSVPVLATCPHGDLVWTAPGDVGKPCRLDGKPLRLATKADAAKAGLSLDYFERFGLRPA